MSTPFSGILIPPSRLPEVGKDDGAAFQGDWFDFSQHPQCWLCGTKTKGRVGDHSDLCATCKRPLTPPWLTLPTGVIAPGVAVVVRPANEDAKEATGIVTRIHYGEKRVAVHMGNPQSVSQEWFEETDLCKGRLVVIDDKDPRATLLLSFLVCGRCGNMSKLKNGEMAFADAVTVADKKGRLRLLKVDVEEKERQHNAAVRLWKDKKCGFENMVNLKNELDKMKQESIRLRSEVSPVQFWCAHCGWAWVSR